MDGHWNFALYKGLGFLQLKDGRHKVLNLNRDDAAGFQLDSTFTHKQQKILAEAGNPGLTMQTDFINILHLCKQPHRCFLRQKLHQKRAWA